MKFKANDLVTHVTGGPTMVVMTSDASGKVTCQWFDQGDCVQTWAFPEDHLGPAGDDGGDDEEQEE